MFMSSIKDEKVVAVFENQVKNEKNCNAVNYFRPEDHNFFTNPDYKRKTESIYWFALKVNPNTSLKENLDIFEKKRENNKT